MPPTDAELGNLDLWDSMFRNRGWGRYPAEELVRFIFRRFGAVADRSALRVLDLGCGPGANLWFLARENFTVAGIDGSPHALRLAEERLRQERPPAWPDRVELRCGDFSALPWPEASFDAVVEVEAMCRNSMAKIRQVIGEIHRVLKPGGLFFGQMFGDRCTGAGSGAQLEPNTSADPSEGPMTGMGITHFFTAPEIRTLFADFAAVELGWSHRSGGRPDWEVFEWFVIARR